jgi:hypothetical protein
MNQTGVLAIIIMFVFLGVVALFTLGLKVVNSWVCTNLHLKTRTEANVNSGHRRKECMILCPLNSNRPD